jgi:hypothetical protein
MERVARPALFDSRRLTKEKSMTAFRSLLVAMWLSIAVYTAVVVAAHGPNLFPVFFGDMLALTWAGQFNLDFTCMLTLSGLWTAWRNRFSPAGLVLGVLAFLLGAWFLTTYLLVLLARTKGDLRAVLLGARA